MSNILSRYETMDPYILMSAVNLKLRDEFANLEDLCKSLEIDEEKLNKRMKEIGYTYNAELRQYR